MANRRMINGYMWEDEFFLSLSMFDRLLWIGVVTASADDQGRFTDSCALIRSKVFPMDDIRLVDIETSLQKFANAGKVIRYQKEGKKCVQIINWWKHQTPQWAGESPLPAPDGWIDRYRYHTSGGKSGTIKLMNWDKRGGYVDGYEADYIASDNTDEVGLYVNDDVNDDDDGKATPAAALRDEYQSFTGDMRISQDYIESFQSMIAKGITAPDLHEAMEWRKKKGMSIPSPEFLEKSAIYARDKRDKLKRQYKPAQDDGWSMDKYIAELLAEDAK